MPITVIVRSGTGSETRLTFDGMQHVVIGRGASCDVRLPEPSVSHRHASLRAQGPDFVIFDEGSTNGTFVRDVPVAPRTSRIVRSGDLVRVGRLWLELRTDQVPATRDVAGATRDVALALVAQAMAARGEDSTARVRVVEGSDQGATMALREDSRAYVLGRGADCDLPLSDEDASRQHTSVVRRNKLTFVCDLGAKNGTWIGSTRAEAGREVPWRPSQLMRLGRSVLALEEPLGQALSAIEDAPDEALVPGEPFDVPVAAPSPAGHPPNAQADGLERETATGAPMTVVPIHPDAARSRRRRWGWSLADLLVMAAALSMLALSMAGLLWLLR